MGAVVHGSSFPLAGSHLVLAGNQLEETQYASIGSPPVRKYFSVSVITVCRELVTLMSTYSTKVLLKPWSTEVPTIPRTFCLSLILRITGYFSCPLWHMVEEEGETHKPTISKDRNFNEYYL